MTSLSDQRREYGQSHLEFENLPAQPWLLLELWLKEALKVPCLDATAFVLATSSHAMPDARVVLAKEVTEQGIVFYTNYESTKAEHIGENPNGAACFYWAQQVRQVRVQGTIEKVSQEQSHLYFKSRPQASQAAAIVSPQSKLIDSRQILENKVQELMDGDLECPSYWGGFRIIPSHFEFFQGRDSRIHDRFQAIQQEDRSWKWVRLAP